MGQQGPPARDAASAARARRVARGSLLLTTGTAPRRAKGTCSLRFVLRALDPDRKTRKTSSRPAGMPPGGRLQIGTMAGFKSERVAGFNLECMAGFVGIRTLSAHKNKKGTQSQAQLDVSIQPLATTVDDKLKVEPRPRLEGLMSDVGMLEWSSSFEFVPADFNLSASRPAPGLQRTSATRIWRPGRPAADRGGSPTVPCAGGSPSWSG